MHSKSNWITIFLIVVAMVVAVTLRNEIRKERRNRLELEDRVKDIHMEMLQNSSLNFGYALTNTLYIKEHNDRIKNLSWKSSSNRIDILELYYRLDCHLSSQHLYDVMSPVETGRVDWSFRELPQ